MNNGLPENWITAPLREVAEINPRHPKNIDDELLVTFTTMAAINESSPKFNFTEDRLLGKVRKGFTHFAEGDVLFAKITPCMENGKGAIAHGLRNKLGCGTTELHVIRPKSLSPEYVYRFLAQERVRREAKRNFTGTAGQARVPRDFIENLEIPIPPIQEQARIVLKLEKLLDKVGSCQKRLEKFPVLLKRFRQSVLAAACSGRLTENWRNETGTPETTDETTIADVAEYVGGFAFKSKSFLKSGKNQVVRIGNVKPFKIDLMTSPVFIPDVIVKETKRFQLQHQDVVISMTGTKYKRDYGFAAIVDETQENLFLNQRVGRLRPGKKILPMFLLYWLQSDLFRNFFFSGETGNVNQGNVGADGIRNAPILLPSIEEQSEIVRRIDSLLDVIDQIESRYKESRAYIDKLTRSILAKAFRGELVPQDPNDEPASQLLEKIKKLNGTQKINGKKKKTKK